MIVLAEPKAEIDLVIPQQPNYDLLVKPRTQLALPTGVLAPIISLSGHDHLVAQVLTMAGLKVGMGFGEIMRRVNVTTNSIILSEYTHKAPLYYNANSSYALAPSVVEQQYSIYSKYTHEDLLRALIAEYPVALWGAITSMAPEDVAAITVENLPWTMKALAENRGHMQRVSSYCSALATYISRCADFDGDAREILEAVFQECGWEFYKDVIKYFSSLFTLGVTHAARTHDSGKGRILQIVYQPKPLTVAERDLVDKHVDLSIKINESFRRCVDAALLLYAPQYLQMWSIISEVSSNAIRFHHPERTGIHSTLGDILAVSDVMDVLTKPRIYKLTYKSPSEALKEMRGVPHLNTKIILLLEKALSLGMSRKGYPPMF